MFVYEKDDKVNIVLDGNLPKESPDITVGKGSDGKGEITIDGKKVSVSST